MNRIKKAGIVTGAVVGGVIGGAISLRRQDVQSEIY